MSKKSESRADVNKDDQRVGSLCVSLAGHDAGLILVIVGGAGSDCVYVADGKTRKLSSPKLKKTKHISILDRLSQKTCEEIAGGKATDSLLRREINRFIGERLN